MANGYVRVIKWMHIFNNVNTRNWWREYTFLIMLGYGHDESAPTPGGMFATNFVGVFIYAGAINRPLQLRTVCDNAADGLPKHKQHKHKNTTIVHHPTVTYFIKHTYSLTLIHIIYNIMHIFNCLREHLDNTKTAETYLNINLLKICKRLIFSLYKVVSFNKTFYFCHCLVELLR